MISSGARVVVMDRSRRPSLRAIRVRWVDADLLVDDVRLPTGHVVLLHGNGDPKANDPWRLVLDNAITTARLLPALVGRQVTLVSSIHARESQSLLGGDELEAWCREARLLAAAPCPPWRAAALCRRLVDLAGPRIYGASRLAQEHLVAATVRPGALTVLRVGELFGPGTEGVVARLARDALAGREMFVGPSRVKRLRLTAFDQVVRTLREGARPGVFELTSPAIRIADLAGLIFELAGARPRADEPPAPELSDALERFIGHLRTSPLPQLRAPIRVVTPPRPVLPDVVAHRQQEVLWSGAVKAGNRWTRELEDRLRTYLRLPDEHALLLTNSGTEALRLAIAALCGLPSPGDLAALPSFTYPATADALAQMGYGLRFVDVDQDSWTMDPRALAGALEDDAVRVVVAVDTFGNPCHYQALRAVCRTAHVPLIGDSAAGLGARHRHRPLGTQADAHAFSMSFAKVLSAAGSGGAVVVPRDGSRLDIWTQSALMDELHAIAALDQLPILDELVRRRERVADRYRLAVARTEGLRAQRVPDGGRHSLVHFVVRVQAPLGRDGLQGGLDSLGIQTRPYFSALHKDRLYRQLAGPAASATDLPVTDQLHTEVLALPMSSELSEEDAERVAAAVEYILGSGWRAARPGGG
jgi:dTDP-4-amino-4,6-dideoxygalactose transaminase/nucleoside-diphosphate-sugar epimerase